MIHITKATSVTTSIPLSAIIEPNHGLTVCVGVALVELVSTAITKRR